MKIRQAAPICVASLILSGYALLPAAGADAHSQAVSLNNSAVKSLNKGDFVTAIASLDQALTKESTYKQAWQNMAVAYNNQALAFQKDVTKALKAAHKAVFYDPQSSTALGTLRQLLEASGKDPRKPEHLIALGDEAMASGDGAAALVDFQLASKLTNDDSLKDKLDQATKSTGKLADSRKSVFGGEEGDW